VVFGFMVKIDLSILIFSSYDDEKKKLGFCDQTTAAASSFSVFFIGWPLDSGVLHLSKANPR
jgi:hypothetical protein